MAEEYLKACPLCSSEKFVPLSAYAKHHLMRCRNCGFVFSRKIPELKVLVDKYDSYKIQQTLSSVTAIRYREMLDYFELFRKTGNIIDVGCGDGYLLCMAKERGWNVYGTEFTESKVAFCTSKGINMKQGPLELKNYSLGFFDVVISIEVIEHINTPCDEVGNFNSLLRNGGIAYITTPNFNSVSRLFLKEKWNVVAYPAHLCYFTRKTLCRLFNSSGFGTISVRTTGISFSRAQQSVTAVPKWDDIKITDEKVRQAIEHNFLLRAVKKIINTVLNLFKAGDAMKAVFIKQ